MVDCYKKFNRINLKNCTKHCRFQYRWRRANSFRSFKNIKIKEISEIRSFRKICVRPPPTRPTPAHVSRVSREWVKAGLQKSSPPTFVQLFHHNKTHTQPPPQKAAAAGQILVSFFLSFQCPPKAVKVEPFGVSDMIKFLVSTEGQPFSSGYFHTKFVRFSFQIWPEGARSTSRLYKWCRIYRCRLRQALIFRSL